MLKIMLQCFNYASESLVSVQTFTQAFMSEVILQYVGHHDETFI